MKKTIPYICTLVYGISGGLLVESTILFLSIMSSPFSEPDQKPLLILCAVASIFSALIITATVIVNSAYLIDLDNRLKSKRIAVAELLVSAVFGVFCWSILSNHILKAILF